MIGAMPLLVVDVELTTIEARLSQKHLREDFENIHSTFLYKSPMIEPGMGTSDLCQDMFLPLTGSSL